MIPLAGCICIDALLRSRCAFAVGVTRIALRESLAVFNKFKSTVSANDILNLKIENIHVRLQRTVSNNLLTYFTNLSPNRWHASWLQTADDVWLACGNLLAFIPCFSSNSKTDRVSSVVRMDTVHPQAMPCVASNLNSIPIFHFFRSEKHILSSAFATHREMDWNFPLCVVRL